MYTHSAHTSVARFPASRIIKETKPSPELNGRDFGLGIRVGSTELESLK
jgi:hypothetical protein